MDQPTETSEIEGLSEDPAEDEVESRVDLRDIAFVTIDGEDAKDFDDAVWCTQIGSGWRLLVAIADVSHYVQPATALDRDAQARCTSVYFPRKVIPMLPEKLSNGLCSLNPGVDRCTLVCDMIVASTGIGDSVSVLSGNDSLPCQIDIYSCVACDKWG